MFQSLLKRGVHAGADAFGLRSFASSNNLALIKELREKSQAPMNDVRNALMESQWDMDKAFEVLRKKGLAAAVKKSSRAAADGLVALARSERGALLLELNSETDFVARNDAFRSLALQLASEALHSDAIRTAAAGNTHEVPEAALREFTISGGKKADEAVTELAGVLRENLRLRRAFFVPTPPGGLLGSYLHTSPAAGLGRIGTLIALEPLEPGSSTDAAKAADLAQKVAMQVAAMRPRYLHRSAVPPSVVENEKEILKAQIAATGKPAAAAEKMLLGRLGKFYQEACLVDQPFVMDDKQSVGKILASAGLRAASFLRVQVGEGVESKPASDFRSEVEAMARG